MHYYFHIAATGSRPLIGLGTSILAVQSRANGRLHLVQIESSTMGFNAYYVISWTDCGNTRRGYVNVQIMI